jgi:hypothetical protein
VCSEQNPDRYPVEDNSLDPELTPLLSSEETDRVTEEGPSVGSKVYSREIESILENSSISPHSSSVGKLLGKKNVAAAFACLTRYAACSWIANWYVAKKHCRLSTSCCSLSERGV